jgi:hypothetical protein
MDAVRFVPLGYQQIAVSGTAGGLTVPEGATMAVFTVDAASVRWRDDGTAPTASAGMTIRDTDAPFEYTGDLEAIEFIAVSGSPVLNISYYKQVG